MFKRLFVGFAVAIVVLFALARLNRASAKDAFLGDSLTFQWGFPRVNDGVYGQTSEEILARTPVDIATHGYKKVFILAGTNDVLLGIAPDVTERNLEAMVSLAQQNGIQPILCTLPPIFAQGGRFLPAVDGLNERIRGIAARRHLLLVDYYSALRDHPGDMVGGIHMKRRSYTRMEFAILRVTNPF